MGMGKPTQDGKQIFKCNTYIDSPIINELASLNMRDPVPEFDEFGETPWPLAALQAGDLKSALAGYATRHMLDYRRRMQFYADADLCGFGTVLWLMGDRLGAASVWSYAADEAFKGRFRLFELRDPSTGPSTLVRVRLVEGRGLARRGGGFV